MTARDEVLAAASALASRSADGSFTVQEVVEFLRREGSRFTELTIRTHVTSRMCSNAPDNHASVYDDLVRVDRGRYVLRS
jgi:hypothetical protein